MNAKYIVFDMQTGGPTMIIFGAWLKHSDMKRAFESEWPGHNGILSAGELELFIRDGGPAVSCFGRSTTLGVESNPKVDDKLANRLLLGD